MSQIVENICPSSPLSCVSSAVSLSNSDPQIQILYSLPDARIVEFKPSGLCSKTGPRNETGMIEVEPGTLSWASRFERTIAVGSLRVYRALGSIAFLNCQDSIRPILPKSQAWCVDGESKFVLRSSPLFWRIEIPNMTQDQAVRVQGLKNIFNQILLYEKTPCPFRRNFIDLSPSSRITIDEKPQISPNKLKTVNEMKFNIHNNLVDRMPKVETLKKKNRKLRTAADIKITLNHKLELSAEDEEMKVKSNTNISPYTLSLTQSQEKNLWPDHNAKLAQEMAQEKSCYLSNQVLPSKSSEEIFSKCSDTGTSEAERDLVEPDIQTSLETSNRLPVVSESQQPFHKSYMLDPNKNFTSQRPNPSSINTMLESRSDVSCSGLFDGIKPWHAPLPSLIPFSESSNNSEIAIHSSSVDSALPSSFKTSKQEYMGSEMALETSKEWNSSGVKIGEDEKNSILKLMSTMPGYYSIEEECEVEALAVSNNMGRESGTAADIKYLSQKGTNSSPAFNTNMHKIAHNLPITIIQKTVRFLFSPPSHLIQFMLDIASSITNEEWRVSLSSNDEIVQWDSEDNYGRNSCIKKSGYNECMK